MSSFADSFWSEDLNTSLDVLFERLYYGCEQCDLFIQLFASRMQYEVAYGRQLYGIENSIEGIDVVGYDADVSIELALKALVGATSDEGNGHLVIASKIETSVLQPFSNWRNDHRERVKYSEKLLKDNASNFQKSRTYVSKLERDYFNKCRKLEDFKRAKFNEDELTKAMGLLKIQQKYETDIAREREFQNFATVGAIDFDFKTMRETLKLFLRKLPKSEYKLPLINYTLQNTNNGSEITKFIIEHLSLKDSDHAELFGQDLLNLGFLKYCNGVGNHFVNSKKFQYQWKEYAYTFAQLPLSSEPEKNDEKEEYKPQISSYIKEATSNIEAIDKKITEMPTISKDENTLFSLMKDVELSDSKYSKESFKMDTLRCSVEELMIDHLSFMEKCEIDRLKALKKATFDFCSVLGNNITTLKLSVEKMVESEEMIHPVGDLLHMISKYRTGTFQPRVIAYNNYYNPGAYQNFGIDLETRCRLDKKAVPLIVSVILSYMDHIYPDLSNDKVRTSIWTAPVKLNLTHQLRALLNISIFSDDSEILKVLSDTKYDPSTVASVLKIYLLELPEPLIVNDIYDVLKVLYTNYPPSIFVKSEDTFNSISTDDQSKIDKRELPNDSMDDNDTNRIRGLYTTLSSLPKPHIATLDSICTHFYRLIKILKMGESGGKISSDFTQAISQEFANCIIQVKISDGNDLGCKIFYDLVTHKKQIFKILKYQNVKTKREMT